MTDYHINVFHSAEDGGYIAEIPDLPDLPGCSAFGQTPEAAVAEVAIAKHAWLEAAAASGLPVPEPRHPASPGSGA
jgi:predicted RNase H-like HicB family nuclease